MRIVNLTEETRKNILKDLLKRSPSNFGSYADTVEKIVNDVRDRGDEALFGYTKQFDKADINAGNVLVTKEEIEYAYTQVDEKLIEVIRKAKENIRTYHEKQRQYSWFDSDPKGIMLGQKVTALESVGVYVPGGKAVYPSSVLMNIMPAKVAGVKNIIMTLLVTARVKYMRLHWLQQMKPVRLLSTRQAAHRQSRLLHMERNPFQRLIRS